MRKRRKRILCIALSVLLVITSFQVAPIRRVKATALSAETTSEALMILWNLVVNAVVATGAGEMAVNYDQEALTFETFMETLRSCMGAPEYEELLTYDEIILANGTSVLLADVITGVEDGTITIPDVEEWQEMRSRISVEEYMELEGWGGSEPPEKPKNDDEVPQPQFTNIQKIVLGSGVIAALADTVAKFWNGEIEGVDLSQYINVEGSYTGIIPQGTDGSYLYYGYTRYVNQTYYGGTTEGQYVISRSSAGNHDFCLVKNVSETNVSFYTLKQYVTGEYGLGSVTFDGQTPGISGINYGSCLEFEINVNFPVFESESAALFYLQTGIDADCINKAAAAVNQASLASRLPSIMNSIAGVQMSPYALQDMYSKMKSAYQTQVKPQIEASTDTDTNTETYAQAMTQAVTETDTDVEVGTDPVPTPEPETEEETETETTTTETEVDVEEYKVNLKEIFPFCIPFDFIALLDVLDAEPEAPAFEIPFVVPALGIDERYKVDLSMFDEQMELVRIFETISFVVLLMYLTPKFIKW